MLCITDSPLIDGTKHRYGDGLAVERRHLVSTDYAQCCLFSCFSHNASNFVLYQCSPQNIKGVAKWKRTCGRGFGNMGVVIRVGFPGFAVSNIGCLCLV